MCACDTSINSDAPYTAAILTTIDIASCAAGPRSPASIAWSRSLRLSVAPTIIRGWRKTCLTVAAALLIATPSAAQRGQSAATDAITILKPARVWDGETMHEGWSVRVKGERIDAVGPESATAAAGARVIDLPGTTL